MKISLSEQELALLPKQTRDLLDRLNRGERLQVQVDNDAWYMHRETGEMDEDGYPETEDIIDGDGNYGSGLLWMLCDILGIEAGMV